VFRIAENLKEVDDSPIINGKDHGNVLNWMNQVFRKSIDYCKNKTRIITLRRAMVHKNNQSVDRVTSYNAAKIAAEYIILYKV